MKCYNDVTPLWYACHGNSLAKVKSLLEGGEDPNVGVVGTTGNTPLIIACSNRKWEFVKLLLEFGADPNQADSWGETPLLIACEWHTYECVKLLVDYGANIYHYYKPSNSVLTPIRMAKRHKWNKRHQTEIIKFIHSKRCEFEQWLYKNIELPEDMIKEIHSFL